jgi:hypothetical protein
MLSQELNLGMLWFTKPQTGDNNIMENLNKNHSTIDHRKLSVHKILISRKETLVKVTKNLYLKFDTLVKRVNTFFIKQTMGFMGFKTWDLYGITL